MLWKANYDDDDDDDDDNNNNNHDDDSNNNNNKNGSNNNDNNKNKKMHPLSLLKRKAVTKLEQFKKLDYHLGWKLELIRRNIDMGAEVGGKEQVEI